MTSPSCSSKYGVSPEVGYRTKEGVEGGNYRAPQQTKLHDDAHPEPNRCKDGPDTHADASKLSVEVVTQGDGRSTQHDIVQSHTPPKNAACHRHSVADSNLKKGRLYTGIIWSWITGVDATRMPTSWFPSCAQVFVFAIAFILSRSVRSFSVGGDEIQGSRCRQFSLPVMADIESRERTWTLSLSKMSKEY